MISLDGGALQIAGATYLQLISKCPVRRSM